MIISNNQGVADTACIEGSQSAVDRGGAVVMTTSPEPASKNATTLPRQLSVHVSHHASRTGAAMLDSVIWAAKPHIYVNYILQSVTEDEPRSCRPQPRH